MWDRLSRVAAPAVKPLSLEAAKAHLRVEDEDDDALIEALIDAAIAMVDGPKGIGLAMIEQTWLLSLDRFERTISLPLGPAREIVSVEYVDGNGDLAAVDADDFIFSAGQDPAVLTPLYGQAWPVPRPQPGTVRITYKAGFGATAAAVPSDLVAALKLIVGHLYANREAVAQVSAGAILKLPMGVEAIFDRYRAFPVA